MPGDKRYSLGENTGLVRMTYVDGNTIYNAVTYDAAPVIDWNKSRKNSMSRAEMYKGNLVHVGKLSFGDIERLKNMGYNLLSPDRDEVRRALLYIQRNEPHLLCVEGKPFARERSIWH